MWVAYLDESSADERRYMTMAAVLCVEAAIPQLTAGFDAVVAGAAERYGTSLDAEIHVTAMVSRIDGWEDLPDVSAAVNLVHEAIDVMCGIDEIQFVTRGLDVVKQRAKGYPEVWGPRRVSMQHVLEYCNEVMRNRGSFMVVADDMAKPDEHRNLLKLYRQTGTPGFRHSTLERVLDNIYFMRRITLAVYRRLTYWLECTVDGRHKTTRLTRAPSKPPTQCGKSSGRAARFAPTDAGPNAIGN